jgi:outer membrane protein TolC
MHTLFRLALFGLVCSSALAEEAALPAPPEAEVPIALTLDRAIELALKRNLDLEVERLSPRIAAEGIAKAKAAFDPVASLSYKDRDTRSTSTSTLAGATSPVTRDSTYAGGLTEKLPTGTSLDLALSYVRSRSNSTFSTLNPSHTTGATLTVKQSLLKGFGTEVNRGSEVAAAQGRTAARHAFEAQVAGTVSAVEGAYWDLVASLDDVSVKRAALEAARSLEATNQAKVDAGTLPRTDLLEASSAAASREADLIDAERKAQDAQDALRKRVDPPPLDGAGASPAWAPFVPVDKPVLPDGLPDATASVGRALYSRPELAQARAAIQVALTHRMLAGDGLKPDLSVSGSWGQAGVDGDRMDAFSHLSDGRARTWEVGISVEMPLGNRAAKSDLRKAEAQVDQETARLRALEQTVVVEVRGAVRALESGRRRLEASERAVAFSSEKLRAELLRFDQGLSTTHAVLDALQTDTAERGRLLVAQVDCLKSLSAWHKAQGSLLEAKGVRLD